MMAVISCHAGQVGKKVSKFMDDRGKKTLRLNLEDVGTPRWYLEENIGCQSSPK